MSASRSRSIHGVVAGLLGALTFVLTTGSTQAQGQAAPGAEPPGASASTPPRVALVIGNSSYRALKPLPNPVNDAKDMCAVLERMNFVVFCASNVPSRRAMRELVQQFSAKLRPGTLAMFYYAGHGVQVRGENYLLPSDIDVRSSADVEDEALSLSYVLRMLDEARSAPNVVILDACRDNPFPKTYAFETVRGLARTDPPIGTLLTYATAPNSVAIDGNKNERNGLFTKHLLQNLPRQGLKLEEVMQIVANSVEKEARTAYNMEQVPFRSSSYTGNYCLAGCENAQFVERFERIARQSDEATRRIRELSEENEKLRMQARDRSDKITGLEKKIDQLNEASSRSGVQGKEAQQELQQLRAELDVARKRQHEIEKDEQQDIRQKKELADLKGQLAALQKQASELEEAKKRQAASDSQARAGSGKDSEVAELRNRLALLQQQTQQLEQYRRQVEELQKEKKENEERARVVAEKQKSPQAPVVRSTRPAPAVMVPSF